MPSNKPGTTPPTTQAAVDPRAALKARLISINLAGKRFSEDEKWMKDAIEAALATKLDAKIAALSEADLAVVVGVLDMAK